MKKLLLMLTCSLVFNAFACLTEEPSFNVSNWEVVKNELYGTFKDTNSYTNPDGTVVAVVKVPSETRSSDVITLSLPATVSVKVNKFNDDNAIYQIKLQYLNKNGEYVTVKDLSVTYDLTTNSPVPHFGINTLDPAEFVAGDTLQLKVFITDGLYEAEIDITCVVEDNRRPN